MGDMIAAGLNLAFENICLKGKIARSKGFLNMIKENRSVGMLVMDSAGHALFSNRKADQICSRLVQKYPPSNALNTTCPVPEIMMEKCLKSPVKPSVKQKGYLSFAPGESYCFHFQPIDKDTSGMDSDLVMVTIEDSPGSANLNNTRLKDKFMLTRREIEIVSYILKGFTNREIALTLFIDEGTVKNHLKHIFSKTQVKNRTSLVSKALFLQDVHQR
ncbi:MAG: response regulator transcription factor [Desulfobacteraceae bacterium]|nr:response regulator transcription factor [Desulfobacteraceae bacterium]